MSPVRTGQIGDLSCGRFNALRCGMGLGESADQIEEPGAIETAERPIHAPGFNGEAGGGLSAGRCDLSGKDRAVQKSVSCIG
jgi:hypothetical protein